MGGGGGGDTRQRLHWANACHSWRRRMRCTVLPIMRMPIVVRALVRDAVATYERHVIQAFITRRCRIACAARNIVVPAARMASSRRTAAAWCAVHVWNACHFCRRRHRDANIAIDVIPARRSASFFADPDAHRDHAARRARERHRRTTACSLRAPVCDRDSLVLSSFTALVHFRHAWSRCWLRQLRQHRTRTRDANTRMRSWAAAVRVPLLQVRKARARERTRQRRSTSSAMRPP